MHELHRRIKYFKGVKYFIIFWTGVQILWGSKYSVTGYSKIEIQCIRKNYWRIFKISILIAVGIKKRRFLMRLWGMDQNSYFLDAIDREAVKVGSTPTIKTAFLVMALRQKLLKPSFKSYVNKVSLCQACFLKLKFPCLKIF